jgi:anti-anti-sigma regulatory factor
MSDLRLRCDVTGTTTVVTVEGTADARRCDTLRDGLEMATMLRPRGPIVIDLGGVDRLAAVALLILRRAADDARRAGRTLTVRRLRQEIVDDPASVRLFGEWTDPPAEPGRAGRPARRRSARKGRVHHRDGCAFPA